MNKREYASAIRSAVGGCADLKRVTAKHMYKGKSLPIIVDDKLEGIAKTKDLLKALSALGVTDDVNKSHKATLRRGLKRLSKVRHFRNTVLIVSKITDKIGKAGRNIPGVDVCSIDDLNIKRLAPGAMPRLSIWTESAITGIDAAVSDEAMRKRR